MRRRSAGTDRGEFRDRLARGAAPAEERPASPPGWADEVLSERARALARTPAPQRAAAELLSVVTFALGHERYAIESRFLREVVRVTDVTPVPETPPHFAGVTNVRGEVLALVDLRKLFGIAVTGLTDLSRILVLGLERVELGLLADAVHEVTTVGRDDLLEPPGPVAGISPDFLLGVAANTLIALDGDALLADPRLFVGPGAERAGMPLEEP